MGAAARLEYQGFPRLKENVTQFGEEIKGFESYNVNLILLCCVV
jgi:hypothetical protein